MTNYSRGYAFERQVAADLESDGYWTCQARGSHGLADVVAIKAGEIVLVQCKLGAIGHGEWNALRALAVELGAVAVVADRPERGRLRYRAIAAEHLARSTIWPCEPWTADRMVSA